MRGCQRAPGGRTIVSCAAFVGKFSTPFDERNKGRAFIMGTGTRWTGAGSGASRTISRCARRICWSGTSTRRASRRRPTIPTAPSCCGCGRQPVHRRSGGRGRSVSYPPGAGGGLPDVGASCRSAAAVAGVARGVAGDHPAAACGDALPGAGRAGGDGGDAGPALRLSAPPPWLKVWPEFESSRLDLVPARHRGAEWEAHRAGWREMVGQRLRGGWRGEGGGRWAVGGGRWAVGGGRWAEKSRFSSCNGKIGRRTSATKVFPPDSVLRGSVLR